MELLRGCGAWKNKRWMFNGNSVSVFLHSFANVPNNIFRFAKSFWSLNCRIPLKTSAFTCKIIKETLCKLVKFYHSFAKFCSPENLCQLNFLFPLRNLGYTCKIFTFHWKPLCSFAKSSFPQETLHLFTNFFQLLTNFLHLLCIYLPYCLFEKL